MGQLAELRQDDWELYRKASEFAARRRDPEAEWNWLMKAIKHGGPGKELSDRLAVVALGLGEKDRVVAALCISGPTVRLTKARLDEMSEPLRHAAAEVSQALRRG